MPLIYRDLEQVYSRCSLGIGTPPPDVVGMHGIYRKIAGGKESVGIPEISRFFGIIIRMFYQEHSPPLLHAEYSGNKVVLDFQGNILRGNMGSRTALRIVREWIDLHVEELIEDWKLAESGIELRKIDPLD